MRRVETLRPLAPPGRHAGMRRPRRPARPGPMRRAARDRWLLVGLGLIFGLLTWAWWDIDVGASVPVGRGATAVAFGGGP